MRTLIWLLALAAAIWGGYWVVADQAIERGLASWFADRVEEGWQAEAEIETTGFPTAFETRLADLALADPETGLAWRAPELRLSAKSWAPTSITAVWPALQTVSSPFERIEVTSELMRAALAVEPNLSLTLVSSAFDLEGIGLSSNAGWTGGLASGALATIRDDDDPLTHLVRFDARGLLPAEAVQERLDPAGLLPAAFEEMTIRARVTFDAPWDRRAIEQRRPQITAVDLGGLRAAWGEMKLEAAGELTVGPEGVPEGRVTVRAVNWREMVSVGTAAGLIPEGVVPTIERGLELLAGLGGNPQTIDAPLSFQDGFVSFGPIPLGPAPRFKIR